MGVAVDETRYLVVTPRQYKQGYFEKPADRSIAFQRRFSFVRNLPDGNILVIDPDQPERPHPSIPPSPFLPYPESPPMPGPGPDDPKTKYDAGDSDRIDPQSVLHPDNQGKAGDADKPATGSVVNTGSIAGDKPKAATVQPKAAQPAPAPAPAHVPAPAPTGKPAEPGK